MSNTTKGNQTFQTIMKVIIAIASAILGAIGATATSIL